MGKKARRDSGADAAAAKMHFPLAPRAYKVFACAAESRDLRDRIN
jgi:hypothetical protein